MNKGTMNGCSVAQTALSVDDQDRNTPAELRRYFVSLEDQPPTPAQRRAVAASCIAYLVAMLTLLPHAADRVAAMPGFAGIFATAIFIIDICTFVLLLAQFRAGRSTWLLVLTSAYLFSALMAALHLFTFPGAIVPELPVIGPP